MKFYLYSLSAYSALTTLVICLFMYRDHRPEPPPKEINYEQVQEINIEGAPSQGPDQATVAIVVYSDFGCPACGQAYQRIQALQNMNPRHVKWVHKSFPMDIAQNAPAARAGLAAHGQGKFWEMAELLYQHHGPIDNAFLEQAAAQLDLDLNTLMGDWLDPQNMATLKAEWEKASERGIDRTPTIFVNGVKLPDHGVETIEDAVAHFLHSRS